jgi:uncharacterized membrane protein YgcG
MAGAAMAMLGCMDLMRQAQKEQDPTTKALLKNMAMQQCSQGMKDMADAAKNDNNADQLSQSDSPKMAQLQSSPFQDPGKDQTDKSTTQTPTTTASNDSPTPEPTPETPAPTAKKPNPVDPSELSVAKNAPADLGTTDLKPTEPDKLKFDEAAKPGGNPLGTGTGTLTPNTFISQGGKAPSADDFKKVADNSAAAREKRASGSEGGSAEGGSSDDNSYSGGGSKGSGSGEESSIQTMFGQMFGAAAPADAAAGISAGMQMASLGAPGATGDKPTSNIFQYATYRYRILAHQEERVHLRGGSKSANSIASSSALPSREPASKPSSLPDSSAVDQAIAQVLSSSSSHSSSDSDSE